MFKRFRILTAPFAFSVTSFILILAMVVPGLSTPFRAMIALADPAIAQTMTEDASDPEQDAASGQGAVQETGSSADTSHLPVRATSVYALNESAPFSYANQLMNDTPRMLEDIRAENADQEDVEGTLPVTHPIYYNLTDEEYKMLCWCVEGEAYAKSYIHHVIITQVIFNRVFSDRFPNTVKDVVMSPRQFNAMDNYDPRGFDYFVKPITKEAVAAVLNGEVEDMSQGALYFCNPYTAYNVEWFDNCLVTLFEFERHRFYTNP